MAAPHGVHEVPQVTVPYPETAHASKEPLGQYSLNLLLGRNEIHQQNNPYIF